MAELISWIRRQDYTAVDTLIIGLWIASYAAWQAIFGDRTTAALAAVAAFWALHSAITRRKLAQLKAENAALRQSTTEETNR